MELPGVHGNRMDTITVVYLHDGTPSSYIIKWSTIRQLHTTGPCLADLCWASGGLLMIFQVFCSLGVGLCESAQFVQICLTVKQTNKWTKKQQQPRPIKNFTLKTPTFCGVSRRQEIPFLVLMSVFLNSKLKIRSYWNANFSNSVGGKWHPEV